MLMRKIIKLFVKVLLVAVLIVVAFLLVYSISDYRPDEKKVVYSSETPDIVPKWAEIDILTWNIGFAGLGEDMDFFYDGGKAVRTTKNKFEENSSQIAAYLESCDTMEYILLQEVDRDSKRSYHTDMFNDLSLSLPDYWPYFGLNYDVFFVPFPLNDPMGKVKSDHSGVLI